MRDHWSNQNRHCVMEKALCVWVSPLPVVLSQYFRGSRTPGGHTYPQLRESHLRFYWLLQTARKRTHKLYKDVQYRLLHHLVSDLWAESTIKQHKVLQLPWVQQAENLTWHERKHFSIVLSNGFLQTEVTVMAVGSPRLIFLYKPALLNSFLY